MDYDLQEIHRLVLEAVRARIREGLFSERQIARIAGFSQPHVHNILRGKRGLTAASADALLAAASLTLKEALAERASDIVAPGAAVPVPLLEGGLGGGRRFPRLPRRPRVERLPAAMLEGLGEVAMTEVADSDESMYPWLWPGDSILLDTSRSGRTNPRLESIYALELGEIGFLGRCRRLSNRLLTVVDAATTGPVPPNWIDLTDVDILHVVRARVVWSGRRFDKRHIYLANPALQSDPEGR